MKQKYSVVAQRVYRNAYYHLSRTRDEEDAAKEALHLAQQVEDAVADGIAISLLSDVGMTIHWNSLEAETIMWG